MSLAGDEGGTNVPSPFVRPRIATPCISVVVPVYNEEEAIAPFMAALDAAMPKEAFDLQVVFVNDGSHDGTLSALAALAAQDPRLVIVNLSRNFGKEAALTAGLDHARGDVVVPMDVDLQDPPAVIPRMLEKWAEGYDVVLAVRASRDNDTVGKRMSAQWFYYLFNSVSSPRIPVNVGDFRLIDRRVVEALSSLGDRNRFMKGLFAWTGFSAIAVEYVRGQRTAGRTKWNYWKLWNFALDGIFSFSTAPLRVWTYLGLMVAVAAIVYAGIVLLRTLLFGIDVPGYASLMVVVLFLGAMQLISIGIIGEYVGRLFIEAKRRPLYLVDGVYSSGSLREDEMIAAAKAF